MTGNAKKAVQKRTANGRTTARSAKDTKTSRSREAVAESSAPTNASQRIEKKIAGLADWRGERLAEIRKLIHEVDPEVVEEWKWMGTPVWSHAGMYVLANAHKDKVKLTFFHGAKLADPAELFNAGLSGNKWRAIDFREEDEVKRAALKTLLQAAIDYNRKHSVPKSSSRV